jgi:immune inhibitor A
MTNSNFFIKPWSFGTRMEVIRGNMKSSAIFINLALLFTANSIILYKVSNMSNQNEGHPMRSIYAVFIILMISVSLALAMPPHPRVLQMIDNGEIEKPIFMQDPTFFEKKGIEQGLAHRLAAMDTPTGQFKAIALLVSFSDKPAQVTGTYFDNLIFGSTGNTVNDYYDEVSYGTLDIITMNLPSTIGWINNMPQTYAYYVDGQYGFGSYPQNAQRLTEDAVNLANPVVDFSQYDNDNDGEVDALFIIHAGRGAEYSGNVNDIWSHAWVCHNDPYVDGVYVDRYSMEPEYWSSPGDMTCGVYVHELGHVFGLPDLYDYDYDSRGLGNWTAMAGGSWNGASGSSPAHLDAYCRSFLGFADPINVTGAISSAQIPAVEDTSVIYRLWRDGTQGTEYFLVENRQRTGYDAYIPWHGLMIYHVDETVGGNDNQWYPGYTSNGHYKVALEQADGDWDLEHDSNGGDNGDPYPGTSNNHTFNNSSTPDSKDYSFDSTKVAVLNVSSSGALMTADLLVTGALSAPVLISPPNGSYSNDRQPVFDFSDSPGATTYHIQIDDNSDFSSPLYNINTLTVSQYQPSSNLGADLYYWRTRAGNDIMWSDWTSAWTVTIDATAPSSPQNLTANGENPSAWTNSSNFAIDWQNPSDLSGIARAYYKLGSAPSGNTDTTGSLSGQPPVQVSIVQEGGVPLYIWLIDNAGNVNYQNHAEVALNYDATRPSGCVAASVDTSGELSFTVRWSRGSDTGGSGLAGVYDVYARVDNGSWALWLDDIGDTSATYDGSNNHIYSFEAVCSDSAGNWEILTGNAESSTLVDTTYSTYVPGDANGDGNVIGSDVTFLVSYFRGIGPAPDPLLAGDANADCIVIGSDVTYLVNYFRGIVPAPVRGDCN